MKGWMELGGAPFTIIRGKDKPFLSLNETIEEVLTPEVVSGTR